MLDWDEQDAVLHKNLTLALWRAQDEVERLREALAALEAAHRETETCEQ